MMNIIIMIVAIIAFIILLLFLVTIHEFGHFFLARKAGVTVHEFAIGMGPKIRSFGKDKKGTEFNLRLLPIGGYVRIKGENPGEEGALSAADSFINASFLWKVAILLGGIVMNIIGAWVIFTIGFSIGMKPIQILPQNALRGDSHSYLMPTESFLRQSGFLSGDVTPAVAVVDAMMPDLLGAKAGLQIGDIIVSINGQKVDNHTLPQVLQSYIGKNFLLVVDRKGIQESLSVTCPDDSCVLGIGLGGKVGYEILPIKFPLLQSMGVALQEMREQSRLTFNGLANIVKKLGTSKRGETVSKLSGPIGAARVGQFVLESGGWVMFFVFGGMLSMGLAIFNLLPIPALDGGRLLGVIIQTGLRLKQEKYYMIEGWINTVFFIALLGLGFYIMAQDLVRAWGVKIPFIG